MPSSKCSRARLLLLVPSLLLGAYLCHSRLLRGGGGGEETISPEPPRQTRFGRLLHALGVARNSKDVGDADIRVGVRLSHPDSQPPSRSVGNRSRQAFEANSDYNGHPACPDTWENPYREEEAWKKFHSALERYETFHGAQLKCLIPQAAGEESRSQCRVRTLTWRCDTAQQCSGIGDQMAQIQMTFLLALVTDRLFLLYWDPQETSPAMQHLLPHAIDWRPPAIIHTNTSSKQHTFTVLGSKQSFKHKQYTTLLSHLQQHIEHVRVSNQFRVPFMAAYRDAGREVREALSSLGIPEILRRETARPLLQGTILRYLFQLDSGVMGEIGRLKRRLGLFPGPYAGLYLRTGFVGGKREERGHFNWRKIWKDKRQWADMIDCSLKETDAVLGSMTQLYLATDSYTVKQWAADVYGGRVRSANLTLEHVALKESWLSGGNSSSHEEESRAVWIDLLLLAHSQLLARGISGFSMTAGDLCSLSVVRQVCLPSHLH